MTSHRSLRCVRLWRQAMSDRKKQHRSYASDLSDDTADLRGPIGLSADAIAGISQDMKAMHEDWKRQNPGRSLSDSKRQEIYEAASANHGGTAAQARLIAFSAHGYRRRPKDFTMKLSLTDHPIWKEAARRLGLTMKATGHVGLAGLLERFGMADLLALMEPEAEPVG
jgi:hypothetical protein